MPKSELFTGSQREKTCDSCGHTHPWHSLVCPHAKGANCFECQAILPRHYPWCSAGQRDNFFCWATPRGAQRDLEAHYNTHMKARLAQRVAEARR